jgi:type IV pilus assembly protein PilM
MALPFFNSSAKRDQVVAIDLGGRTTKAVYLQRKGDKFVLAGYTLHDAPIYEKTLQADLLTEHLKAVMQSLGAKIKLVTVSVGVADSIVRQTEMPLMAVGEMRQMVKHNTKSYLQQDFPDYAFDCYIVPAQPMSKEEAEKRGNKHKVLVGGAKQALVDELQKAIRDAGLVPDQIVPSLIGPVNSFEMAQPEQFAKEVIALVDIGFKNSTISILHEGDLALSRVVGIGGDKMTSGLAESMGITYNEAEGIKVGMATEVQQNLEPLLIPLGRELRASIDFFEHQQDKTVGQVFISGGSARSEFIVQSLQSELMVPCKGWDPTAFLQRALPPEQAGELAQVAPQLAVAVGTATSQF